MLYFVEKRKNKALRLRASGGPALSLNAIERKHFSGNMTSQVASY